jgi:hypothetical protein
MGDKRDKRRPGRDSDRPKRQRWLRVDGDGLVCWVDRETGDLQSVGDGSGMCREQRDRMTADVLELLVSHGFEVTDPLVVRDFLFD